MLDEKEIKGRAKLVPMDQVAGILPDLEKSLVDNPDGVIAITAQGKPVLALISWESWLDMEDAAATMETLEIMANPEIMAALRQSEAEITAGNLIAEDDVLKRLVADGLIDPDSV